MRSVAESAVASRTDMRIRLLGMASFAVLTAVSAQVSFHLWFTPVPVTLQVLVVILSGLMLGSRWGATSQAMYLAMGASGLPIFADFKAGPAAFVGPTGGYLFGFVLGAFLAGWTFEMLGKCTKLAAWAGGIAGIVGIYLPGAAWLMVWTGNAAVWQIGVVPFIGVDLLKATAASSLVFGGRCKR